MKSKWFERMNITFYIGAIVAANWLITRYGQIAVPFVAFSLIPFDLVTRDLLQDRWQTTKRLGLRMALLIFIGGLISWLTGTGSPRVNLASYLAFTCAACIDTITYQSMIKYGRIFRVNGATLIAAVTDSVIFVLIAFAAVNWKLVGLQIAMKVTGGFCWSLLLYRFFKRQKPQVSSIAKWVPIETGIAPMPAYPSSDQSPFKPQVWGRKLEPTEVPLVMCGECRRWVPPAFACISCGRRF